MIRERKRSYSPPAPPALDQADAAQLIDLEAGALPATSTRVPGARREADTEGPQHPLAQAPLGQVLARLAGLFRLPEVAGVEGGGAIEQLFEAAPVLAPGLSAWVLLLALELDPVAVGEQLDRLGETEPLLLLDELDHVTADPAAEAVVELLLGVDRERRGALLVERAEADPAGALAAQVGVGGDHLDDVRRLLDPFKALGRDQRHRSR